MKAKADYLFNFIATELLHTKQNRQQMKQYNFSWIFLIAMVFTFSSCEVIGDILEVGVWLGIIIAALIVGLVIWIIRRFSR